ncbi:hypothetical protein [Planctomyces sp. SH-PL14]|uniref:hypothetical protein n=1 Tax=Planctomyces sp. SH-PL14 TaxID=1632864 RepID=UPI0012E81030|nr:hypothetical protein [Planctomyces sp. SH-PL14]
MSQNAPSPIPSLLPASRPAAAAPQNCQRACPVCGGSLYEIRHKLHCQRCHTIVETCCEGGRG